MLSLRSRLIVNFWLISYDQRNLSHRKFDKNSIIFEDEFGLSILDSHWTGQFSRTFGMDFEYTLAMGRQLWCNSLINIPNSRLFNFFSKLGQILRPRNRTIAFTTGETHSVLTKITAEHLLFGIDFLEHLRQNSRPMKKYNKVEVAKNCQGFEQLVYHCV